MDAKRKEQVIEMYRKMSKEDRLSTWLWLFERSDKLQELTLELDAFKRENINGEPEPEN